MARGQHVSGSKLSGRHRMVDPDAKEVVKFAIQIPDVSSVIPGRLTGRGSVKLKYRYFSIPAGWKVVVYGTNCIQELIICTPNPDKVQQDLEARFPPSN